MTKPAVVHETNQIAPLGMGNEFFAIPVLNLPRLLISEELTLMASEG